MTDPGTKANQCQILSPRKPGFYLYTGVSNLPAVNDVDDNGVSSRRKTIDDMDVIQLQGEARVSDFLTVKC